MAVVQVVAQLEEDGGLHPAAAVPRHPHGQGDLVHDGEVHAVELVHQQVGVGPDLLQGVAAVAAVEPGGQGEGQVVDGEEVQQPPHPRLVAVALGDLHGPPGGDPLDLAQQLRLLLHHPQGVDPEAVHDPLRRGGAHPLDDPGGQVGADLRLGGGHVALHLLRLDLVPVGGVADPAAGDDQVLPRRGAGDGPHHRHHLAVAGDQAEDGVAVLLILENEIQYGPVDAAAPVHPLFTRLFLPCRFRPAGRSAQVCLHGLRGAHRHPPVLPGQEAAELPPLLRQAAVHQENAAEAAALPPDVLEGVDLLLQALPVPPGGEQGQRPLPPGRPGEEHRPHRHPHEAGQPEGRQGRHHRVLPKLHTRTRPFRRQKRPPVFFPLPSVCGGGKL